MKNIDENANTVTPEATQSEKPKRKRWKLILALLLVLSLLIGGAVVYLVVENNRLKVTITSPEFGATVNLEDEDVIKFDGEVYAKDSETVNVTAEVEGYEERGEVTAQKTEGGVFKFHFETRAPENKSFTFKFIADDEKGQKGSTSIDVNVVVPDKNETLFTSNAIMLSDDGNCGNYKVTCEKAISGELDEEKGVTKSIIVDKSSSIKEGTILIASVTKATPYGLLNKVSKVNATSSGLKLELERATLTDAYKQVHNDSTYNLRNDGTYENASKAGENSNNKSELNTNVTQSTYKTDVNSTPGVANTAFANEVDIPVVGFDLPFAIPKSATQTEGNWGFSGDIQGKLKYNQSIHVKLDIDPHFQFGFPPLSPTVDFAVTRTESTDFDLTINDLAISYSITLFETPDIEIPIPVLPGLVFSPSLELSVGVQMQMGFNITANFSKSKTYGWSFKTGEGIKVIDEETAGDDNGIKAEPSDNLDRDSTGVVTASIGPEVTLGLRINGSVKVAKAGFGIDLTLGLKVDVKFGSEKYIKQVEKLNDCLDRTAIEVTESGLFVRFNIPFSGTFIVGFEVGGWEINLVEEDLGLRDAPLFSKTLFKKTEKTEEVVSKGEEEIDLEECKLMVLDTFFVGEYNNRNVVSVGNPYGRSLSTTKMWRNEDGTKLYKAPVANGLFGCRLELRFCEEGWSILSPEMQSRGQSYFDVMKITLNLTIGKHDRSCAPTIVIKTGYTTELVYCASGVYRGVPPPVDEYYNPLDKTLHPPFDSGFMIFPMNVEMWRVSDTNFLPDWYYLDKTED